MSWPGVCAFLLLASANILYAQHETDEVVRVRTDLATVTFTVTDTRGQRIPGLTQTDFLLLANGQPCPIEHFASGTERVALLFLLDASGSTRDIIQHQRETALALFSRFGRGSRLAALRFGEKTQTLTPFTDDIQEARRAFLAPPAAHGDTAIFDSAAAALRAFAQPRLATERRIVTLISDGLDNASKTRATDVIRAAQGLGITFYVLHLPLYEPRDGSLQPRAPAKGFKDLALKTGGRYFRIGTAQDALNPRAEYDLRPIFQALADDLASQYLLGCYPRQGDKPQLKVDLRPAKRGKFRAQLLQ